MKLLVVLAVACLCLAAPLSADLTMAAARKAAPDFTLRDTKGAPVRLSALKGKVVLLDFWATWCTGCKVEIPWFDEFQKTYRSKGLFAVGVAMDEEGWKAVTPYLKAHPIGYPIVTADANVAKQYNVAALPITVLIDRTGKVASTHVGLVDKAAFEQELRKLLDEKPQR